MTIVNVRAHGRMKKHAGLATELVTTYVSERIVRGEFRRGEQLPTERELVSEIGVSRTSVRAGLQALAAKRVLVTRRGAGTFIADGPPVLDSDPLTYLAALHGFSRGQMFEARRTLEVGLAGMAAERATGEDFAAISHEVTSMFATVDDPQALLVHDIRFHQAVAKASQNPILASLVEMVSAMFYELRRRTAGRARELRPTVEIHRKIYQAIRDRDRTRAEKLMFEHLMIAEQEQDAEDIR